MKIVHEYIMRPDGTFAMIDMTGEISDLPDFTIKDFIHVEVEAAVKRVQNETDRKLYLIDQKSDLNIGDAYWKSPYSGRWYEVLKVLGLGDEIDDPVIVDSLEMGITPQDEYIYPSEES